MDKTVTEAKAEVESFITSAVIRTGLETLRTRAPQLLQSSADESTKMIEGGKGNNETNQAEVKKESNQG